MDIAPPPRLSRCWNQVFIVQGGRRCISPLYFVSIFKSYRSSRLYSVQDDVARHSTARCEGEHFQKSPAQTSPVQQIMSPTLFFPRLVPLQTAPTTAALLKHDITVCWLTALSPLTPCSGIVRCFFWTPSWFRTHFLSRPEVG